jgi:hypothetical protein
MEKDMCPISSLLIYIPTHTDYRLAIEQAVTIKNGLLDDSIYTRVHIHISINGVSLNKDDRKQIADVSDSFSITTDNIGADANIAKGFQMASESSFDFLWILSANDLLKTNAISVIQQMFSQPFSQDILLFDQVESGSDCQIEDVFKEALRGSPLGLISAVIFNTNLFKNFFSYAAQYVNTGWTQLAILNLRLVESGVLKVKKISSDQIYSLDQRTPNNVEVEFVRIGRTYARSFFGLPALVSMMTVGDCKRSDSIIDLWMWKNWYLIAYFKSFLDHENQIEASMYSQGINTIRKSSLKNRILLPLVNNSLFYSLYRRLKEFSR